MPVPVHVGVRDDFRSRHPNAVPLGIIRRVRITHEQRVITTGDCPMQCGTDAKVRLCAGHHQRAHTQIRETIVEHRAFERITKVFVDSNLTDVWHQRIDNLPLR